MHHSKGLKMTAFHYLKNLIQIEIQQTYTRFDQIFE